MADEYSDLVRSYRASLAEWREANLLEWRTRLTDEGPIKARSTFRDFFLRSRSALALQLAESRADALAVERRNAKLLRTVDCLQDWFARSSRRADAMQTARDLVTGDNAQLREQLAQKDAVLAQVMEDLQEATGQVLYLKHELDDTVRGYQELKDAVQLAALKKKGAR